MSQSIRDELALADWLDNQGRPDEATQVRSKLVTSGVLSVTGAGAVAVKGGQAFGRWTGRAGAHVDDIAVGPVNFMGDKDRFFQNASKRPDIDPNGNFDVIAHGSSHMIEVMTSKGPIAVNQRIASKLIKNNPNYKSNQPIRLLSCETGTCSTGFAQNLANKMGVPVQAPTDLVWAYPNGTTIVAPRISNISTSPYFNIPDLVHQGSFRTFFPGGGN